MVAGSVGSDAALPCAPRPLTAEEHQVLSDFCREAVGSLQIAPGDEASVKATSGAAFRVVDALVSGLCGSVGATLSVRSEQAAAGAPPVAVLVATLAEPATALIATRSRLPMELTVTKDAVEFRLALGPPPGCPSYCSCHMRLFGYAARKNAELRLVLDGVRRDCPTLLPPAAHDLSAFVGGEAVFLPRNEFGLNAFKRADVEGKIVVLKHDQRQTPSQEEKLLRARAAGAIAVIFFPKAKVEPELGCCTAGCLPAVHLRLHDGEALVAALRAGGAECLGIVEVNPQVGLECGQPVPSSAVWLHLAGLSVRRPLSSCEAWNTLKGCIPVDELTPEGAFQWFLEQRDRLFPLESTLFNRVIESIYSRALVRRSLTLNNWGDYLLQMLSPACDREIRGLRFEPCKACASGIGVSGAIFPEAGHADAHELIYSHVLETCRTLLNPDAAGTLKKTSPSAEAWARVTCSQFANCPPADASTVTKLLTPCTGPQGSAPSEPWQRADVMWNIVDGYTTRQGRVWWRRQCRIARNSSFVSRSSRIQTGLWASEYWDARSCQSQALSEAWFDVEELRCEDGGAAPSTGKSTWLGAWTEGMMPALTATRQAWRSKSATLKAKPPWREAVSRGTLRVGLALYDCCSSTFQEKSQRGARATPVLGNAPLLSSSCSTAASSRAEPPGSEGPPEALAVDSQPAAPRALTSAERSLLDAFGEQSLHAILTAEDSSRRREPDSDLQTCMIAAQRTLEAVVTGLVGSLGARLELRGDEPVLVATLPESSVAWIATRSRLPLELAATDGAVEFRLTQASPAACPSRVPSHMRLFGYASQRNGELRLNVDGERHDFASLLPPAEHDLSTFSGGEAAFLPDNAFGLADFEPADVEGKVLVLKHDQRTSPSQDAKLLRARAAGAVGVIFYSVRGAAPELKCCTSSCLPAIQLCRKDGKLLVNALRSGKSVELLGLFEVSPTVGRECGHPTSASALWLMFSGLRIRRPVTSRDAWEALSMAVPADERTPERAFQWFLEQRTRLFPLESTLFNRVIESVYSRALLRRAISLNAWGDYLLHMLSPSNDREIHGFRFELSASCPSGVGVSGVLFPCAGEAERLYYNHVMDTCYTLMSPDAVGMLKRTSPSAEAWARLAYSQYAGCAPADAATITKLLTPCTGPVGAAPNEAWQRADPMWNIVDSYHASITAPMQWQGRLWWRREAQGVVPGLADVAPAAFAEMQNRRSFVSCAGTWSDVVSRAASETWYELDDSEDEDQDCCPGAVVSEEPR